jgi:cytochrome c oxidase subunit II
MADTQTTADPGGHRPLSTLLPPERVWWKKLGPDERTWLTVAFIWCLILFTGMLVWLGIGDQQTPIESYRIDPATFRSETEAFINARQVGEENGVPIVAPEPGEDAYLQAQQFQFRPILQLERGRTYRLLVSSTDVQHGLSLQLGGNRLSLNFQVLPEYLYVIRITPEQTGEFSLVCNEYCGLGHHVMTGKLIVVEP